MAVKLLKLITGEDIIADIKIDGGEVTLKNPVRMLITPEGVGLGPLSPLIKEGSDIKVSANHIVFTGDVAIEVLNGYNAQFGSGIIQATSVPHLKLHS